MKRIGLALAAGALCFALGVAATRLLAGAPADPPAPPYVLVSPADAGLGPRIVFDPASVQLLPDASLRLDLPPGFDAGAP
jgi:hypothetical protein